MTIWTSPETGNEIAVMVVKEERQAGERMFVVHKANATSSKYVFCVHPRDCKEAN